MLGGHQHVAQGRNGIASFDHAMDVAKRLQELRAFDGDLHCNIRPIQQNMSWECRAIKKRLGRWYPAARFTGFQGTVKWRGWGASSRDRSPVPHVLDRSGAQMGKWICASEQTCGDILPIGKMTPSPWGEGAG